MLNRNYRFKHSARRVTRPHPVNGHGNPTLRRNRINDNRERAVFIHERGGGVFEDDNDLTGNVLGPWEIAEDCEENVKRP